MKFQNKMLNVILMIAGIAAVYYVIWNGLAKDVNEAPCKLILYVMDSLRIDNGTCNPILYWILAAVILILIGGVVYWCINTKFKKPAQTVQQNPEKSAALWMV